MPNRWLLASNLTFVVVMTAGAHCTISSLENLLWRKRNLAVVISILDAIVDSLKECINRLGDDDCFIHAALVCFEISGCDLAISIDEMIE